MYISWYYRTHALIFQNTPCILYYKYIYCKVFFLFFIARSTIKWPPLHLNFIKRSRIAHKKSFPLVGVWLAQSFIIALGLPNVSKMGKNVKKARKRSVAAFLLKMGAWWTIIHYELLLPDHMRVIKSRWKCYFSTLVEPEDLEISGDLQKYITHVI